MLNIPTICDKRINHVGNSNLQVGKVKEKRKGVRRHRRISQVERGCHLIRARILPSQRGGYTRYPKGSSGDPAQRAKTEQSPLSESWAVTWQRGIREQQEWPFKVKYIAAKYYTLFFSPPYGTFAFLCASSMKDVVFVHSVYFQS